MSKNKNKKQPRTHQISVNLNDKEFHVLQKYIKKYKISNKAQVIRKALFTYILEQFDKDYPSIFGNNE